MNSVYFARFGDFVKIGFASDPQARLKHLAGRYTRLIHPDGFDHNASGELVLVIPSCRMRDECNLHLLFARHWVAGEWFEWSPAFRYQMETMRFVTHRERLLDLRRARRLWGVTGKGIKEARFGKPVRERIADSRTLGGAA